MTPFGAFCGESLFYIQVRFLSIFYQMFIGAAEYQKGVKLTNNKITYELFRIFKNAVPTPI